jgi:hypothetical protein
MTLDSVTGLPGGPLLGGTLGAQAELKDPQLDLFVEFAPFEWGFDDHVRRMLSW